MGGRESQKKIRNFKPRILQIYLPCYPFLGLVIVDFGKFSFLFSPVKVDASFTAS